MTAPMQIYVQHNDRQLGPFTEAELKVLLNTATISLQDYVWWQGQADWVPLIQSPFAVKMTAPGTGGIVTPTGPISKLAIWSLVLGCMSLLCGLVLGPFASVPPIILGHMALSEIKKNPTIQGRGLALAGLIIGYVMTALIIISLVATIILMTFGNEVKTTFATIAAQNQKALAAAASDNDQSTNSPDQSTNSAPSTDSSDSSTNSTPKITP